MLRAKFLSMGKRTPPRKMTREEAEAYKQGLKEGYSEGLKDGVDLGIDVGVNTILKDDPENNPLMS